MAQQDDGFLECLKKIRSKRAPRLDEDSGVKGTPQQMDTSTQIPCIDLTLHPMTEKRSKKRDHLKKHSSPHPRRVLGVHHHRLELASLTNYWSLIYRFLWTIFVQARKLSLGQGGFLLRRNYFRLGETNNFFWTCDFDSLAMLVMDLI